MAWFAGVATAQPVDVTRVLKTIDFEERRLGNAEDLPMHWLKADGPGLPHYVNGQLAKDRARSGKYSFRFDLDGGSLVYRYETGQIHVRTGAHYRVEGYCQTTVLPHARARISASLTDVDGHPIPESTRHSDLYAAQGDGEDWKQLSLELSAEDPRAAFLVIDLELLQPSLYGQTSLGRHALWDQDIRGNAWFDDIVISQVPKVTLSTDRPGNVFRAGEQIRLRMLVNDRFTDDLAAQLIIKDARGQKIYQRSGALDLNSGEKTAAGQRVALDLPNLPPGWYEASLEMSSQNQPLGEQKLALIRLADDGHANPPDPRFGIVATDLPFEGWSELPALLPYFSVGRVKLGVWTHDADVQQMDPAAFDRLLERLQELAITPTACLLGPPPDVAAKIGGSSWERLLTSDRANWQPQLAYLIARHAAHLDRWQLGADSSDAFVTQPNMRRVYDLFYREFAELVEKPDLAMPWPAWYELSGELPATVALSAPPSVLPSQLPMYMQDINSHKGHNLSLTLETLDRDRYGRDVQIRDLAQRVIYALTADAQRLDLPLPFTVERGPDNSVRKQPQELFIILRTLTSVLAGTTYRGRVPLADGVEAFLFDKHGQGILAIWDRGNVGGVKQLPLNLGDRATRVDLWGNVSPLLHRENADKTSDGLAMSIGPTPVFLMDIDGAQAQLRASVAIDRPLIESSFEPHTRKVRFTNPYHTAISGMLKLRAPDGWTLNPPTFSFSINPGEVFERDVEINFPYNSYAGAKTIQCEFSLPGEPNPNFAVPLTLNLGLSDVGMQTLAIRDGDDVVVQQMISNYGERPIDYGSFAIFPGQARQERLVTGLGPGRTTLKKYRFTAVGATGEVKVRVGVKELVGTRILNDEVPIQ